MLNAYLQNLTSKQKKFSLIGITLMLLFVAYGNTQAAIPNSDTAEIVACYRNSASLTDPEGALRVIDKQNSDSCVSGETELTWEQGKVGAFLDDLTDADFSHASLHYRDFANTDFTGTDFSGANLTGANLEGSNFTNSSLSSVILKKANLKNTTFQNAYLSSSDATNAIFQNATFTTVGFGATVGGDFRDTTITGASTFDSFNGSNLSGLDLTNFDYIDTKYYTSSDLSEVDLSNLTFARIFFENSDLSDADLSGTVFTGDNDYVADFNNTTLDGTDFTNAVFEGTKFFGSTDLSTATLTGATWDNVTCPDGTNSDNNGNTCIGHLVP